MLRYLRGSIKTEKGFALVELLVVILVLGILATLGFPSLLAQQKKGHDAETKSNVRNAVSVIELCHAETRSFLTCDSLPELREVGVKPAAELTDSSAKKSGAVSVSATADTYTIVGYSRSDNTFTVVRNADGTFTRSCTTGGEGGCNSSSVW